MGWEKLEEMHIKYVYIQKCTALPHLFYTPSVKDIHLELIIYLRVYT